MESVSATTRTGDVEAPLGAPQRVVGLASPALASRLLAAAREPASGRRTSLRLLTDRARLASAGAFPCDAVILGIGPAEARDVEDVRAVRAALPHLPLLVVVAAETDDALGDAALREGADDYLVASDIASRSLERGLRHARERFAWRRMLERSGQGLRAAAETTSVPVVVHRDDTILWANEALVDLLGATSLAEVCSGTVSSWMEVAAGGTLETRPGEPGEPGEPSAQPRRAAVRGRGSVAVAVEVRRHAVFFDGLAATLSLLDDVADRERRAHSREQHERLASLGRLAANLGHEINNPLSYVVSNLRYLAAQLNELSERAEAAVTPGDLRSIEAARELEETRRAAADALEGSERVAAIVRDVRVLSRIESRELAPVRIADVLQSAVRIANGKLGEVARVDLALQETPPVQANETALLQVFVNLLVNAADACAELPAEDHDVKIVCFTDAEGRAVVEIRDTGPGLADEVRDRVFEPFFTTKPSGSGFGLAISYALVESFGGILTLETDGLRGALARVVLPPMPRAEAAERATPSASSEI